MASTFPPFDGSAPKTQQFAEPPEMGIDPAKRYTATKSVITSLFFKNSKRKVLNWKISTL